MRRQTSQAEIEETKKIWQGIRRRAEEWAEKRGLTHAELLAELARRVGYPEDRLKNGFRGAPEPVIYKLRDFAEAFNLSSGREGRSYEETIDALSDEELKRLFKLEELEERQGRLWED